MNLFIRIADVHDASLIADLSRKTFYDSFIEDNNPENINLFLDEVFTREALIKEVGAEYNIFLLAYQNDIPAGYARLREFNSPPELGTKNSMEIARLYVLQDMIGKGIGAALMQHCIDISLEKGKQVVWLGVWEKNARAIAFYTQWGFEKFSNHDFVLGHDIQNDWLMKKELNPQ